MGCCEVCLKKCHAGHQIGNKAEGGFYCDCGDGDNCKANKTKEELVAKMIEKGLCTYKVTGTHTLIQ